MKTSALLWRILVLPLFLGLSLSATAVEKYALLIGVTKYEHARINSIALKYPEEDAKAVADLLKQGGYTVKVLLGKDATKSAIEASLKTLSGEGNADGVVLIGMFGHGVQYDELPYFGPFDMSARAVKDSKGNTLRDRNDRLMQEPDPDTMVSMQAFLAAMTLSKAKNKIMLADCCREGPGTAHGRDSFGSNITTADLPDGTAAIFACSWNEQAYEHDDWSHGAFTKAFLDQVVPIASRGNVEVQELAERIYESVKVMDREKSRKSLSVTYLSNGDVTLQLVLSNSFTAKANVPIPSTPEEPSANAPSTPLRIDLVTNNIGMKLKLIPAGEFMMGSPSDEADRDDNEGPLHKVLLKKSYYMGVTEVTQGEWFIVMKTKPWEGQDNIKEGDNYPAVYVSWDDAVEYCRKLSALEAKAYRLPTEAEWEYACRGGKSTAFSFGSDVRKLPAYAWYDENSTGVPVPVAGKGSNPFGLYDMHGNVAEWCSDWHGAYSAADVTDPAGPIKGSDRVFRSGWTLSTGGFRSANRGSTDPADRYSFLGFRLALSSSVQ